MGINLGDFLEGFFLEARGGFMMKALEFVSCGTVVVNLLSNNSILLEVKLGIRQ